MMSLDRHHRNKTKLAKFRDAMYHFEPGSANKALDTLVSAQATIHLAHPLGSLTGPREFYETAYAPLHQALPDLERRDFIVMAGPSLENQDYWVGCCGYYQGRFMRP